LLPPPFWILVLTRPKSRHKEHGNIVLCISIVRIEGIDIGSLQPVAHGSQEVHQQVSFSQFQMLLVLGWVTRFVGRSRICPRLNVLIETRRFHRDARIHSHCQAEDCKEGGVRHFQTSMSCLVRHSIHKCVLVGKHNSIWETYSSQHGFLDFFFFYLARPYKLQYKLQVQYIEKLYNRVLADRAEQDWRTDLSWYCSKSFFLYPTVVLKEA
jgi:hypothetical protein